MDHEVPVYIGIRLLCLSRLSTVAGASGTKPVPAAVLILTSQDQINNAWIGGSVNQGLSDVDQLLGRVHVWRRCVGEKGALTVGIRAIL